MLVKVCEAHWMPPELLSNHLQANKYYETPSRMEDRPDVSTSSELPKLLLLGRPETAEINITPAVRSTPELKKKQTFMQSTLFQSIKFRKKRRINLVVVTRIMGGRI
jgi:hypothetical protein